MNCIFCKIINKEIPAKILYEDDLILAFLDINPNSNGHTLVIPKKHSQNIKDIKENDLLYILNISRKKLFNLLTEKLSCEGITITQNNGLGQDIKHFHIHLIPRYKKQKKEDIGIIYNKLID